MERGVRVTGVDIAPAMMARLLDQLTPAHTPPDLLLADATSLPFSGKAFPAILFVHVLHLIPGWRRAVAEMLRVLAPDGVILSSWDQTAGSSDWDIADKWWKKQLREAGFKPRRRARIDQIGRAFERAGATTKALVVAERPETSTVREELELTRNRIHSWNWEIPDPLYHELLPRHEEWALERFGGPETELRRTVGYHLQAWRFFP
jgi:ubiquinone/menaquinone biosynthesis C-methylase UbiE